MSEKYHNYYRSIFNEKWDEIFTALTKPDRHVLRANKFYFLENTNQQPQSLKGVGELVDLPPLKNCFNVELNFSLNEFSELLLPFYKMDAASIIPALALDVAPDSHVLDMCAAPGGKSLVLFEQLEASGRLTCNEYSSKRKHRLMSVIKRYIPHELRHQAFIHGQDGNLYGLRSPENFDRILLDAPCSGDRDLIQTPSELDEWKEKRTKSFGIRQYSLLASALSALKPGGNLIYSTCSLSPYENDEVIKKLIKRRGEEFNIVDAHFDHWGQKTEYGNLILPTENGFGPIFYAKLIKN